MSSEVSETTSWADTPVPGTCARRECPWGALRVPAHHTSSHKLMQGRAWWDDLRGWGAV